MSSASNIIVRPTIFREYIGVKPLPESLNDFPAYIINSKIPEFHFILGFASEDYVTVDTDRKGTGHFKRTWNAVYFSPEKVMKLKEKCKNAKVIISIGGHGTEYPFNPAEKRLWIFNAIHSIKQLIQDYQVNDPCHCHNLIDGIDIHYEHIKSSEDDFSTCIGEVIKQLKKDTDVSINVKVVSIAPTELVQSHYRTLYWANKDIINWVDYQFYNQAVPSKDDFVALYNKLVNEYHATKVLAGVSTVNPPDPSKMSREVFIEGIISLLSTSSLPGIFVWNANDSAIPPSNDTKPYLLEEMIQNLLAKPDC